MMARRPDAEPHRRARRSWSPRTHRASSSCGRYRSRARRARLGIGRCASRAAGAGREHARPRGGGFHPRTGPAGTRSHPPRDALGRSGPACLRADVLLRAGARGVRGPLAEKQTVQNWIADSAAEIQACRLLTMDAARKIDEGSEARVDVSLMKFFAAKRARTRHRPGDPGARRPRADGRDAAREMAAPRPERRGSTTAPTRCTAWSSPGRSSARSPTATAGRSRRPFGRWPNRRRSSAGQSVSETAIRQEQGVSSSCRWFHSRRTSSSVSTPRRPNWARRRSAVAPPQIPRRTRRSGDEHRRSLAAKHESISSTRR